MKISDLKVMKSNAGYYIGRSYYDEDCGIDLPYDRLSGYYRTREEAEWQLKNGRPLDEYEASYL